MSGSAAQKINLAISRPWNGRSISSTIVWNRAARMPARRPKMLPIVPSNVFWQHRALSGPSPELQGDGRRPAGRSRQCCRAPSSATRRLWKLSTRRLSRSSTSSPNSRRLPPGHQLAVNMAQSGERRSRGPNQCRRLRHPSQTPAATPAAQPQFYDPTGAFEQQLSHRLRQNMLISRFRTLNTAGAEGGLTQDPVLQMPQTNSVAQPATA